MLTFPLDTCMDVFLLGTNQLFCLYSCYLDFPWITSVSRLILNFSTDTFPLPASLICYIEHWHNFSTLWSELPLLTVSFLSIPSLSPYLLRVKEAAYNLAGFQLISGIYMKPFSITQNLNMLSHIFCFQCFPFILVQILVTQVKCILIGALVSYMLLQDNF